MHLPVVVPPEALERDEALPELPQFVIHLRKINCQGLWGKRQLPGDITTNEYYCNITWTLGNGSGQNYGLTLTNVWLWTHKHNLFQINGLMTVQVP